MKTLGIVFRVGLLLGLAPVSGRCPRPPRPRLQGKHSLRPRAARADRRRRPAEPRAGHDHRRGALGKTLG